MRVRTTVKIVAGILLVVLVTLLMDQDKSLEEAQEAADAASVEPPDLRGAWAPLSVSGTGGDAVVRGGLVFTRRDWGLLVVELDSAGAPARADVEAGQYHFVADTLLLLVGATAQMDPTGADPAAAATLDVRRGDERSAVRVDVDVEGDRLTATMPDGRVYTFERREPSLEPERLRGSWEPRRSELESGAEYAMGGRLLLGDEAWLAALFTQDSTGVVRHVRAEWGRYAVTGDTLRPTVTDRVHWGRELPGAPAVPLEVRTGVEEQTAIRFVRAGSLLILELPEWGRVRLLRIPAAVQ